MREDLWAPSANRVQRYEKMSEEPNLFGFFQIGVPSTKSKYEKIRIPRKNSGFILLSEIIMLKFIVFFIL